MATQTGLPGGDTQQYYTDINNMPATGGLMRPAAVPGMMQGAGLNFVTPPPPPPRQQLASMMSGGILGQGLAQAIDGRPGGYMNTTPSYLNPRSGR
jgi:hypothetical protein